MNKWSHICMDNFPSLWSPLGVIYTVGHSLFLEQPMPSAASISTLSAISHLLPGSHFIVCPLNGGFLQGFSLTTISYLFIKYIFPEGIPSIYLVWLPHMHFPSWARLLCVILNPWCIVASLYRLMRASC